MNKLLSLTIALICALCANAQTGLVLDTGREHRPVSYPAPAAKDTPETLPHTWNARSVKGSAATAGQSLRVFNPILPGFNPDPGICAVDSDYYLVTSSFVFLPGLPVYHSRDLVNWELIGHGIDRQNIGKFHFENLNDNDGIWAPAIRYHHGLFYIVCTMHRSGGNFFMTARDPRGPWSDPVWIPGAQGIDPTLFWDEGKCYYIGNRYDFRQQWQGQVGVWIQEIDLDNVATATVREPKTGLTFEAPGVQLKGEPAMLTYGHANNRTADSYYTLMKGRDCIRLTRREKGRSAVVAQQPCKAGTVRLSIEADSLSLRFLVDGQPVAAGQSMRPLCDDGKYNKFNGLGVGVYATSTGRKSKAVATFR